MRERGFTLIEVLIAVAVLAIALIAVVRALSVGIRNSQHLQQKVLAHWVAENVMANYQVGLNALPAAGNQASGDAKMLDEEFVWQTRVTGVTRPAMLKVMVTVENKRKTQSLDVIQRFFAKPEVSR